mgnify:CR=1 FL=1
MNYYRRYCGDYLRDTQALSLAEHGAYTLLLDLYYSIGHPIPAPIEILHRICRAVTVEEQAAVVVVAERYFPLNGDGTRHNKRADKELETAISAIEKMRAAGLAGALKRWQGHGEPYRVRDRVRIEPPTTIPHPPKERSKTTTKPTKSTFELPDWIPAQQWEAWLESRAKARKSPTAFAKKLAVAKLQDLEEQGHSPAAVLAQSAFNGWSGLFPVKDAK